MEKKSCCHCGNLFIPDPRQKDQRYCGEKACQRARKASWQREKMHSDPDYRANQKQSQESWLQANEGYWKRYREAHPEQAQRNRDLQRVRNRRCRFQRVGKMDTSMIAKMDASRSDKSSNRPWFSGPFWLVPEIAKMDAIKVNIYAITGSCP